MRDVETVMTQRPQRISLVGTFGYSPVFYHTWKVGRHGKPFRALTFRTMVREAESVGGSWTIQGDPRITPLGRILRKTGLDELPQLLNILRGDMSFVGPRAYNERSHATVNEGTPGFHERLVVLPGLTGMATVYGRSTSSERSRLKYELWYIRNMGPMLDCKLILLSVLNTLTGRWEKNKKALPAVQRKDTVTPAAARE